MLDLPFYLLQAIHIFRNFALMMTIQSFSTGIAKIVPTSTGHMGASFSFLNDLTTLITLSILFGHLELNRNFDLTLSLVGQA